METITKKTNAIEQDAFDRFAYGQAVRDLPELAALNRRSNQASAVMRDVHASLYKLKPKLLDDTDAQHRDVMEQLMETSEYQQLRATTRMSEVGAAFGAMELGRTLIQHLPETEDAEQQPGEGPGGNGPLMRGCRDMDEQRRQLRKIVREAQARTEEGVEDAKALSGEGGGWGSGEGGDEKMSLADAVALAKRLRNDPRLKRIAELAGRMRRIASGKRETRYKKGPDDVVGVEFGNDLSNVLQSELVALCDEDLQWDALLRFTEKRLLQTKREGKQRIQNGPVIVLVDESISMEGERDVWAKALALGILSIAKKEKRSFACGTFNSRCWLSDWGKNPSMDTVLSLLSRRPSGGTSFTSPLGAAMTLIERAKARDSEWEKADIVFITDGECCVPDHFAETYKQRMEATGAHLYVIGIGSRAQSLDCLADGTAFVSDLTDDSQALELAFGI